MNIRDSLFLAFTLRFLKTPRVTIMPDGLFISDTSRLRSSKGNIPEMLESFSIGDPVQLKGQSFFKIFRLLRSKNYPELFEIIMGLYPGEIFPFVPRMELEDVLAALEKFKLRTEKTLYERFMELNTIMLFLESLKNGKIMLGGVWISRSLPGAQGGKPMTGYEVYVKSLSSKNEIIEKVKSYLDGYPPYSFEEIGLLHLKGPRSWMSGYSRYLENLYLQVNLKNETQRMYLMSQHITSEERDKHLADIECIKTVLERYRIQ